MLKYLSLILHLFFSLDLVAFAVSAQDVGAFGVPAQEHCTDPISGPPENSALGLKRTVVRSGSGCGGSSLRIGSVCHFTLCLKLGDGGERVFMVGGGDRKPYPYINTTPSRTAAL